MKRKGQATLRDLPTFAITLGLALVLMVVGGIILQNLYDSEVTTESTQVNNESLDNVLYGVNPDLLFRPVGSIIQVRNNTEIVTSGNYSLNVSAFSLSFSTVVNKTLNFTIGNPTSNVTINGSEAQILRLIRIVNATNGLSIELANFTVLGAARNVIGNATNMSNFAGGNSLRANFTWEFVRYNNTDLNVTYTYTREIHNEAVNITQRGIGGLETFAENMEIVAVAIAGAVIIGLILGALILNSRASRGRSVGGV